MATAFSLERRAVSRAMAVPTFALVVIYLVLAPALTLGFKFLFSTMKFHYPMSTVLCLLSIEWGLAAAIRRASLVSGQYQGLSSVELGGGAAPAPGSGSVDPGRENLVLGRVHRHHVYAVVVGGCLSAEIACSNLSLLTLSVSFHTMLKASTPAFVLLFSTLLGLEAVNLKLALAVGVIVLGAALASFGEVQFALSGFVYITAASAAGGLRWSLSYLFLRTVSSSPLELLYLSLPWAIVILPPFCLVFEAREMEDQLAALDQTSVSVLELLVLLLAFAVAGFAIVFVELSLVERMSSVTFAVLSAGKESLVVFLGIALNHDVLTPLNGIGFALTLCGIVAFKSVRSVHGHGGAASSGDQTGQPSVLSSAEETQADAALLRDVPQKSIAEESGL